MILPPLLGALINWLTWKGTPEAWDAYRVAHPRKAFLILVLRMFLPHLRQIPKIAAAWAPSNARIAAAILMPALSDSDPTTDPESPEAKAKEEAKS